MLSIEQINKLEEENKKLKSILSDELRFVRKLLKENNKLKEVNTGLNHYLACMTEQRNNANNKLFAIKNMCQKAPILDADWILQLLENKGE